MLLNIMILLFYLFIINKTQNLQLRDFVEVAVVESAVKF